MTSDVIVIGGGAAGLLCAHTAASNGKSVILIERNDRLGKKLLITGKGRCNVTNHCEINDLMQNIPQNGRFLYGAFYRFSPQDTMEWFEQQGVPLKVERGNRVFPVSDHAQDIVQALEQACTAVGVIKIQDRIAELLVDQQQIKGAVGESGEHYDASSVVVATGGKSYPQTGSTGDGYPFAKQTGHTVTPLRPSLIPIVTQETWCKKLQGLSLRNVTLTVEDLQMKRILHSELGELLFTHFGVSGPLVLSASAHIREMQANRYRLLIDLKPALSEKQLDLRILRDFSENNNRDFGNSLGKLLPRKLIPVMISLSEIPYEQKVNQISREQRLSFVHLIKNLSLTVKEFRPMSEAIITSGGVSVTQINPKTMESKVVSGLYFVGEVLDVDAYTGGFNLQIAFSTGYSAGMSIL